MRGARVAERMHRLLPPQMYDRCGARYPGRGARYKIPTVPDAHGTENLSFPAAIAPIRPQMVVPSVSNAPEISFRDKPYLPVRDWRDVSSISDSLIFSITLIFLHFGGLLGVPSAI